jgi:antitoxin component of MazEF toxin-antitoxin module
MKYSFVGKLIKVGDSVGVIIPAKLLKASGLKVGDLINVSIQKIHKDENA